jgi:hypothetical protein
MKKLNSLLLTVFIIGLNLTTTSIFAQDEDPGLPIDGDPGAPATTINDWILPIMTLVLFLMFFHYKTHQKQIKK